MPQIKPREAMKRNIKAILATRHQTQKDLAVFIYKAHTEKEIETAESSISQIFTKSERGFPMKYWGRICDFLGIETYQLFAPGINGSGLERRSGRERRTGLDRRRQESQQQARPQRTPELETVTPGERALLGRIRRLKESEDRKQLNYLIDRALLAQDAGPKTGGS